MLALRYYFYQIGNKHKLIEDLFRLWKLCCEIFGKTLLHYTLEIFVGDDNWVVARNYATLCLIGFPANAKPRKESSWFNKLGTYVITSKQTDKILIILKRRPPRIRITSHYYTKWIFLSVNGLFPGVYDEPLCSTIYLNHAVLVVGYATGDKGQEYWIVKNRYEHTFQQIDFISNVYDWNTIDVA